MVRNFPNKLCGRWPRIKLRQILHMPTAHLHLSCYLSFTSPSLLPPIHRTLFPHHLNLPSSHSSLSFNHRTKVISESASFITSTSAFLQSSFQVDIRVYSCVGGGRADVRLESFGRSWYLHSKDSSLETRTSFQQHSYFYSVSALDCRFRSMSVGLITC